MYQLVSLSLENFGLFKDCEIRFDAGDRVFVRGLNLDEGAGSNAAGKSHIFDAIRYAIYGTYDRGPIDSLVHDGAEKATVELVLGNASGTITIRRSRGKSSSLEVVADGKEVGTHRIADTEAALHQLLAIPEDVFENSIFWGQNSDTKLLSGTDKELKDLLGTLCYFALLDKVLKEVRQDSRDKGKELETISSLKSRVEVLSNVELVGLHAELDGLKKESVNLSLLSQLDGSILEDVRSKCAELALETPEDWMAELESVVEKGSEVDARISKASEDFDKLLAAKEQASSEVATVGERLRSYEEAMNLAGDCPTCKQPISDNHRCALSASASSLGVQLEELKGCLGEVLEKESENSKRRSELQSESSRLVLLGNQMRLVKNNQNFERYFSYGGDSESLKTIQEELSTALSRISELERRVGKEEAERDALELYNKQEKDLSSEVRVLDELEEFFGQRGIRMHLLGGLVEDLNHFANEYLGYLLNRDVSVDIKLEEEKVSIQVMEDGREASWRRRSGGEKKRVAVALRLAMFSALVERGSNLNFFLVDEIFGGLDVIGRDAVVELLEYIGEKYSSQVVMISQFDLDLAGWSTLTAVREDNVSRVEYS